MTLGDSMLVVGVFCLTLGSIFAFSGDMIDPLSLLISGAGLFIISFIFRAIENKKRELR